MFKVSTAQVFRNSFKLPSEALNNFAVKQISKVEKAEDLLNSHPDDKDSLDKFLSVANSVSDELQKRFGEKWVNPNNAKLVKKNLKRNAGPKSKKLVDTDASSSN